MNSAAQFYHKHEAWIAVIALCIAMYGIGWVSGTLLARSDTRAVTARMDTNYRSIIATKDKLIEQLARSTATTATQAATATGNAATAATLATQAADSATTAAAAATKAVENKKTLEKLK